MSDFVDVGLSAFATESGSILETAKSIDPDEFRRAVVALAEAERIGAAGCGHSGIACQHFTHLMCCVDRPARFIYPSEAVHGGLGYVQKGDVLLWASRGGKTDELIAIVDVAKKK